MVSCAGCFLAFCNTLFAISGAGILGAGVVIQNSYSEYSSFYNVKFYTSPTILIVIGAAIIVISIFGFCASVCPNGCMTRPCKRFMVAILFIKLVGVIGGYLYKDHAQQILFDHFSTSIHDYNDQSFVKPSWDVIQHDLQCCGIYGPADWKAVNDTFIPHTCCHDIDVSENCTSEKVYISGCYIILKEAIDKYAIVILSVVIIIISIEIFGLLCAYRHPDHRYTRF